MVWERVVEGRVRRDWWDVSVRRLYVSVVEVVSFDCPSSADRRSSSSLRIHERLEGVVGFEKGGEGA